MSDTNSGNPDNTMKSQTLRQWFCEPLGRYLMDLEQVRLARILADLFGYHILQLSCMSGQDLLASSRISHKIILQFEEELAQEQLSSVICSGDDLALAPDSLDVVVMPHVLEFASNPHKLLREVERVLIGEGHLIILGINPWSLWGLWRLFLAWREIPPWNGHFYSLARIKDWLSLLDLEILRTERFFFRPPLRKTRIMQKLRFLENLGKYCWPYFGGAYIIVAKKRVIPLTPTKMRWSARRRMIASGVAEPSARLSELHDEKSG